MTGGDALDYIEILHNNRVIHRWNPTIQSITNPLSKPVKVYLEVGWGDRGVDVDWHGGINGCQVAHYFTLNHAFGA